MHVKLQRQVLHRSFIKYILMLKRKEEEKLKRLLDGTSEREENPSFYKLTRSISPD